MRLAQAIELLAIAGDLHLGQPIDGAQRGADAATGALVARLRRAAASGEVAGDVAAMLGLPAAVEQAVRGHDIGAIDAPALPAFLPVSASLTLVADVNELRLPWLAGHSRRVAALAQAAAQQAGLSDAAQRSLVRAALLHGIGRAAVPDAVWERKGKLGTADWDAVRRAPYWTARAGSLVDGLGPDAQLASQAYERLDGSGYFCSLDGASLGMPQRLLAVAVAWVALRAPRPWRAAHAPAAARALLAAQATGGRLDRVAVDAVLDAAGVRAAPGAGHAPAGMAARAALSAREVEVLQRLSLGESGRQAARAMRISTGAVRTHLDSILGKLGCATRPAATLRALHLGLV